MKVIIILNLNQGFFWPSLVTIAHSLLPLISDDHWPPWRSSSSQIASGIFWPSLVTIAHSLLPLTSDDLWPPWRYHHHKLASGILLTKFGSHRTVYHIWPLMTFDLHEGHHHHKLASGILVTKFVSHRSQFIPFDLWWPLTSMKVIIIINLYQGFFWPSLVAIARSLPHLTSDDLWPQ